MRISYITTYDASDIKNWSGIGFYAAKSLKDQGEEVDYVGNLTRELTPALLFKKAFYKIIGKSYLIDLVPSIDIAKDYAKQIESRIKLDSDVIFSPGNLHTAFVKSNKPKVFYADATFAKLINFYDHYTDLSAEIIKTGNEIEQEALDSCSLAIYTSSWAAQSAINDYHINPNKVKIVPFGANIECNRNLQDIKAIVNSRSKDVCKLLFLGIDWDRKGGYLALEVARLLNLNGLKTILHVAGIRELPFKVMPDYVINHGYINKANAAGRQKIDHLLAECHFLILPSKADCTPVAFSEANSFGLPCITTDVGGISSVIEDDINGKMFTLQDEPDKYVAYIQQVIENATGYSDFCLSSFNQYSTKLNWQKAGENIVSLLKETI
ncbi:MAG: glycosyltransferase family 4 protein [Janthinobacterium lividum]